MADYEYLYSKVGRTSRKGVVKGDKEKSISERKYERMKERYEKRGGETYTKGQSNITVNPRGTKSVEKIDRTPLLYTEKKKSKGRDFPLSPTPGA